MDVSVVRGLHLQKAYQVVLFIMFILCFILKVRRRKKNYLYTWQARFGCSHKKLSPLRFNVNQHSQIIVTWKAYIDSVYTCSFVYSTCVCVCVSEVCLIFFFLLPLSTPQILGWVICLHQTRFFVEPFMHLDNFSFHSWHFFLRRSLCVSVSEKNIV